MNKLKRIMAINDISCFGKCALTITLPIVSAAGIECSVLPSVILSTHTGYPGGTFYDMSSQFSPITEHLNKVDVKFDGILTGFLASMEQATLTENFIDTFKTPETLIVVDPTMADNGAMYGGLFTMEFAQSMRDLCKKADIVTPNITEACFMLGKEFIQGPYTKEFIEDLLFGLADLGPKEVIVTGVYFDENMKNSTIGCAVLNKETNQITYHFDKKIAGYFIGTGDIFSSVVMAGRMLGFSIEEAAKIATEFITASIRKTLVCTSEKSTAINFEQSLPILLRKFKINQ